MMNSKWFCFDNDSDGDDRRSKMARDSWGSGKKHGLGLMELC